MNAAATLLPFLLAAATVQEAPPHDEPSVADEARQFEAARRQVSLQSETLLRDAAANRPSAEARGYATWSLARLLLEFEETLAFLDDPSLDPKVRDGFVARRGPELIADLGKRGRPALKEEAAQLLRKVIDDHFFLEWKETGYLGAAADALLFELEHLQLGMVAPEIEGADEDGVPFKLSDYRGKVVALDFWGFWCPICVRNLPHERVIVEKHRDAAFALVGVNSDPKARLIEAGKRDRIMWRSFFDGGDAYGPIARRWNVTSWPTIFVLDENGVIRMRTEDAEEVGRKVDELLAAMQSAPANPAAPPAPAKSVQSAPPAPPARPAQDVEVVEAVAPTLAQQVDALQKEFEEANRSFNEKYSAAKSDEERNALFQTDYPRPESYVPRFLALAAAGRGEPSALACYLWILDHGQGESARAGVYAPLVADHVASPKLGDAVRTLGRYTPSVGAERCLREVIAKTPHHDVEGCANYALAGVLLGLSELCESMESGGGDPEQFRAMNESYYGKETMDELAARDAQELRDEAEDLLEDVVAGFAKVKGAQGTLGASAEGDLFELRNLQVGKVAPDITGEDVDGVRFNLADYRGKVVVLDFWGFW